MQSPIECLKIWKIFHVDSLLGSPGAMILIGTGFQVLEQSEEAMYQSLIPVLSHQ